MEKVSEVFIFSAMMLVNWGELELFYLKKLYL